MPGHDRTGPVGLGSQTGRKMGKCNPNTNSEINNNSEQVFYGLGRKRCLGRMKGQGFGEGKGQGFGAGKGGMRRRNFQS